jgi:hypothetical protein
MGFFFLISFSGYSLLAYGKVRDFCIFSKVAESVGQSYKVFGIIVGVF